MKPIYSFILIVLLIVGNVAARKVKRSHHRHHKRGFASNLYQFGIGLATELAGGVNIDSCLPQSWKNANPNEEKAATNNVANAEAVPVWKKILGWLGKAINVICVIKTVVEKIIEWFTSTAKRRLRRYMRLYLEGKTRSAFRFKKGWFSNIWEKIKSTVTTAASSVARGVVTAYKTVANGVKAAAVWVGKTAVEIANAVKDAITGVFGSIVSTFENIRAKVVAFFDSDLGRAIKTFVNCLKAIVTGAKNIAKLIEGYIAKIALLANFPHGWIVILVGLICAWEELAAAIGFLIKGFGESDPSKKWNNFGRFAGKLVYVIGTS